MLFDIHFHLPANFSAFEYFSEARRNDVNHFLLTGSHLLDCSYLLNFVNPSEGIFAAVGVHPHEAESFDLDYLPLFRRWLSQDGVVAVGEIGLDYYYSFSPKKEQQMVFKTFLELAAELELSVVIHSREAFDDCYEFVSNYYPRNLPFVMHSFTGTVNELEKWLELGAYVSYNGMLTFKKADNIREIFAATPLDRLLFETDAPYLAPIPYRGKTNQSAYLKKTVEKAAEEKGISYKDIARISTENAKKIFLKKENVAQASCL